MEEVISVSNKKEAMDVLNHFYPDYKGKDRFINDLFTSYGDNGPTIHFEDRVYPSYSNIAFVKLHNNRYILIDYKKFLSKYKKISTSKYVKQLQFESVDGVKFKKGDRVIISKDFVYKIKGKKGTVIETIIKDYNYGNEIGQSDVVAINMDDYNGNFHTCDGKCKNGHGWNVPSKYLKKISNSKHVKQLQFESVDDKLKIGDYVIVKETYNNYLDNNPDTKNLIIDVVGLKGKILHFYNTENWVAVEFDKEVRNKQHGYGNWADISGYKKSIKNTLWFNKDYLKKANVSKHVKQLKFESIKEKKMSNLIERLEKMLMKDKKVLKEEAYEITVKRNDGPKVASILTGLRNVTVTKSFDLNDLVRHRFMISSKVDPDHIETMLKDELKRKRVPININDIKVSVATPKSLEEALVKE